MKSIKLSHDTRNALRDLDIDYGEADAVSYDEILHQLMDKVGDYMPFVDYSDSSMTVIKIGDDTIDRIKSFRLSNGESIENILIRMLITSQVLNSMDG